MSCCLRTGHSVRPVTGDSGEFGSLAAAGLSMASDTTSSPKVVSVRPRLAKYIKWVIALAALAWFGRFAYLRITLRPTPRPEYWAAKIAELDPPGPGALTAAEAAKILGDRSWEAMGRVGWSQQPQPIAPTDLLYGDWNAACLDVQQYDKTFRTPQFAKARDNLIRAVELGWDPQCTATPEIPLTLIRNGENWAQALLAHSRWLCETTGDMGAVVKNWQTVLLQGRQLARRRMSIDESARTRMESLLAHQILRAVSQVSGSINVREFADLLERMRPSPLIPTEYLAGERFYEQSILEFSYVREGGDWLDISTCAFRMMDSSSAGGSSPARLWNLASPIFRDYSTACERLDRSFKRLRTLRTLSECEPVTRWGCSTLNEDSMSVLEGGQSKHLKLLAMTVQRSLVARTHCEGAVAALALAEYRRQHGEYPASLDALVPALLHHVPIDYGDCKPLRYRRLESDDYLLYSIGLNGRDDGGHVGGQFETTPDRFHLSNPDAVFSKARRLESSN